jgi:glycosyltransferase involved in cell wall biosynthesis
VRIRRSLESVASWAGEIILVINDDVNDGTDRIGMECGAKVFREPWKGYRHQMNSAAEKAGQPWILAIDADEVISPALAVEIQTLFASAEKLTPFAAFSFPRCSFYCGRWIRHGDWYPDRKTRLWRRGQAHWGGEDPHYTLVVTGRTGKLKNDLYHYTNESINRHLHKITTFSDEFVRQRLAAGRLPSFFDVAFRPFWRFVRAYFFRLGFLDGWPGYYIAWLNAFSAVTRYCKLYEAQLAAPRKDEDIARH